MAPAAVVFVVFDPCGEGLTDPCGEGLTVVVAVAGCRVKMTTTTTVRRRTTPTQDLLSCLPMDGG